ncbi:nucleotide-binding universal stress UspA family protein [Mumia flava]|uniref:Nucleotide-binding universal stress UspA family protein n=1 Tax=Mumia flava TaxID=1348852 RepID=A0A2M9BKM6_9ACTN|nr:nucleotide-binding universal stress UspA family protein [Mumia flava]
MGIDGSADSALAVAWATDLAGRASVPLRVVDVLGAEEAETDWGRQMAEDRVAEVRRRLDAAGVSYEVETRTGRPAEQLIAAAGDASALVVGAKGHGAVEGLLIGSVSQHVSRHAPCPVVVVREPADAAATRVVVGADGSDESVAALSWAFAHAEATGAQLRVVYAFRTSAQSPAVLSGYVPTNVGDEVAIAERFLDDLVAVTAESYPDVVVTTDAIPVPSTQALIEASQSAALVVVGSRGRGAFEGLLLGSVSQTLLQHAACPVAVVR